MRLVFVSYRRSVLSSAQRHDVGAEGEAAEDVEQRVRPSPPPYRWTKSSRIYHYEIGGL
jgi:hypothetical protein